MSTKLVVGGITAVTAGYLIYNINYNNNRDHRHVNTSSATYKLTNENQDDHLPLRSHYKQTSNTDNQKLRDFTTANAGAKNNSKSIFNWGFNEAERNKAIAIGEYDMVNKKYNDLVKEFQENSANLDKEESEVKKLILKDYEEELKLKKQILEEATEIYNKFVKNENFNELADKIYKENLDVMNGEKSIFQWLRSTGIDDEGDNNAHLIPLNGDGTKIDKIASESVMGWGESAQEFAKEAIEEQLRNKEIGPSEAQKRLDELKEIKKRGWLNYGGKTPEVENDIASKVAEGVRGWGESASQFANDELEDVNIQYDKNVTFESAKSEVEKKLKKLEDCRQLYQQALDSKNGDFIWNKLFVKPKKDQDLSPSNNNDSNNTDSTNKRISKDIETHELKKQLDVAQSEYDHAIDILSKFLEDNALPSNRKNLKQTRTQLMGKLWDQMNE
ncbi:hypothetical protein TPHA_0F01460 [Tetrapisispora phaffii CBS 4417]|uniref:Uncharacterized protein n=1 Tax=Tetrapisispora phaffii (strain ATCC 24235 / CBS 4417 / NBRC 1672 / NRRL Y-8282 / UCD 70-5) TaxID=1071381 RepID=G8BV48_TETPH|nr:hypothetical protein TPHA_0F01460 [Tetrapisispora phaffii CBS 4417]CCE63630.1 hypothetical protein TPHA_0F01460 [Tetrapisispora phaffii CBS 4417]